jgi:hypothetical protein
MYVNVPHVGIEKMFVCKNLGIQNVISEQQLFIKAVP